MQSVLLITESAHLLREFRPILMEEFPQADLSELDAYPEQLVLEFSSGSRIYLENYGPNLTNIGWDDEELSHLTGNFPQAHSVYAVSYHSLELVKQVLKVVAGSDRIWVDNDCGTLLPGAAFVRKMQQQPAWNWFNDLA